MLSAKMKLRIKFLKNKVKMVESFEEKWLWIWA